MQEFLADLHIHSRFSRATSPKLDIPLLAAYACIKGISVLGTGDFTHPKWRDELRENLRFDEASGLYAPTGTPPLAGVLPELPVELLRAGTEFTHAGLREGAAAPVRFMLQGEISSIYKRGGKVRKVHNLVYVPTLEAADALSRKLEAIGNLHSDGRPILGLDSRDLLEMVLECHPEAFLVPAHIWTPWFSVFGSKSGFDRLEDCYGDLTDEIFALETGLSSDPAMNRLWSNLDKYRLISNSDAHSGDKLGREANLFRGNASYSGIRQALKHPGTSGDTRFLGTVEFFPEEGKYHMDGHRKCGVLCTPKETREHGGICPVCGGALTVGVFNRVMELADRETPLYGPGDGADAALGESGFVSLVPLAEVLGEVLGAGPKSRRVGDMYSRVLERFGPELAVLRSVPTDELSRFLPPLGESVARMRRGDVRLTGGYDGEYGIVRMFSDAEQADILRGSGIAVRKKGKRAAATKGRSPADSGGEPDEPPAGVVMGMLPIVLPSEDDDEDFLFSSLSDGAEPADAEMEVPAEETPAEGAPALVAEAAPPVDEPAAEGAPPPAGPESADFSAVSNPEQQKAVTAGPGPVLVLAGPGTGKTHTLIARAMHLLEEGIGARRIVAVTFTRRAASEMDARLAEALGGDAPLPRTDTLHALALELWHKTHADVPVLLSEENARRVFAEANPEVPAALLREAWRAINLARERLEPPSSDFAPLEQRYIAQKTGWNLADYTDLLEFWMEQITGGLYTCPWGHVLVDEIQDLSPLQLHLVRALLVSSGEGFFGIGDPDQSIYSFRGAHGDCREFFKASWPGLEIIRLKRNYRSRPAILSLAHAALACPDAEALLPVRTEPTQAALFEAPSAEAEALWIADRVAALVGTGSHTLADGRGAKRQDGPALVEEAQGAYSPGDIAVLVRTHALARIYRKALDKKGVPVSEPAADAFWADERVAVILRAAERMLGIAVADGGAESEAPVCPDKVLAKGPLSVAAYLSAFPPFDALFWQSGAFRSLVKNYDANEGWAGLMTWINLQNELELVRGKAETVQILSLHAAKGLEFPCVFLPALEDGLLPFAGPELLTGKLPDQKYAPDEGEERRLFYVGLTRARDHLFLSRAEKRSLYGRELRLRPSRFLESLPADLINCSRLVAKTTRKEQQLTLM